MTNKINAVIISRLSFAYSVLGAREEDGCLVVVCVAKDCRVISVVVVVVENVFGRELVVNVVRFVA